MLNSETLTPKQNETKIKFSCNPPGWTGSDYGTKGDLELMTLLHHCVCGIRIEPKSSSELPKHSEDKFPGTPGPCPPRRMRGFGVYRLVLEWGRVAHLHTLLLGSHILQRFGCPVDVAVHDSEFMPQFHL